VVIPDDGIILDWCFRGSYGFGSVCDHPFAIALVLLDGAAGPDRKKIALAKIRRSRKKKPFSLNAGIEPPRTQLD